jgi:glycosyltransferase involved in cell wall biosynthesis
VSRDPSQPFTVSYTGNLYMSRSPVQFFEGMRAFIEARKFSPEQFRFRWAGQTYAVTDMEAAMERAGVLPYIDFLGQIPHRQALQLMMDSDAALLVQAPDDAIHIPGKLFEALGARTPLLALAHPCEVTEIIERCRAGIVCPHTPTTVAAALTEFERRARKGLRWEFNESAVESFSAEKAVGGLARLFDAAIC